ncbi:activin receptor type-2A isoform X1 [Hydra vulgaris]|uniref:activin receptor type-2A isoform X1 n=2 Tax=Hydra vulgaris TaxID=6087 RepID=UPI001F5EAA63|nr:activin receptor type-2A isoform X1 [Hydra vulgaris]
MYKFDVNLVDMVINQKCIKRLICITFCILHSYPRSINNILNNCSDQCCVHLSKENHCVNLTTCSVYEKCVKNVCFVLFNKKNGVFEPFLSGCGDFCDAKAQCKTENRGDEISYMCCCNGNLCNKHSVFDDSLGFVPVSIQPTPNTTSNVIQINYKSFQKKSYNFIGYIFIPFFGILAALIVIKHFRRKRKRNVIVQQSLIAPLSPCQLISKQDKLIKLQELIAHGPLSAVWKGIYGVEYVAVKIIPKTDFDSWENEVKVYSLFKIPNENILKFYLAKKHIENSCIQHWIVTEYHKNGSLKKFLKLNVISLPILKKFFMCFTDGLKYLHSKLGHKPAIAHRDIKSKNILVKDDLSLCISDFGLSLVFDGKYFDSKHAKVQVGTKRYMAPEMLEGSISFLTDSLLFIDMYAFALVLWEILSRCSIDEESVNDYIPPFQDMVGVKPSIDDMLNCVCVKKMRPCFQSNWIRHPLISKICKTISECWDYDAESRLSSSCVYIRFVTLFEQETELINSE